jgi:phage protein
MRNTLTDLNNHLFAQLERLSDEDLKGEELKEELQRSSAVSKVAQNIINNGSLVLQAQKFKDEKLDTESEMPKLLGE